MNPIVRIGRNMAVLRHDDGLTLANPTRLDAAGEQALEALGPVRLGAMHGVDDAHCKVRFGAEFWYQPGGATYPEPTADGLLEEGAALPFADAELFCFRDTRRAVERAFGS